MPSHFSELKLQEETESSAAAHLFAEGSLTMITKTEQIGWNKFGHQSDVFLF